MLRMRASIVLKSLGLLTIALCISCKASCLKAQNAIQNSRPGPSVSRLPGKLADDIEQVFWWLPEETEGVVVSRGNPPTKELWFESRTKGNDAPEFEYQDLVALNCIEPVMLGAVWPNEEYGKMLHSFYGPKTATLFVKAAWWDKKQTRASCNIVVFRDDMAVKIVKAYSALRNVPSECEGVRVLKVDLCAEFAPEVLSRYFDWQLPPHFRCVAAPRPNVYFATTNFDLMKVLIERMKRRGKNQPCQPICPNGNNLIPLFPPGAFDTTDPRLRTRT